MQYILDKNNLGDAVSPLLYGAADVGQTDLQPKFLRFASDYERGFFLAKEKGAIPVPVFSFSETEEDADDFLNNTIGLIASVLFFAKGVETSPCKEEAIWANKRVQSGQKEPFVFPYVEIHSPDLHRILFFLRQYDYGEGTVDLLQRFSLRVIAEGGDVEVLTVERTLPACIDACGKCAAVQKETLVQTVGKRKGLSSAIAEGVLMTSLERNSRYTVMSSAENAEPSVLSLRSLFAEFVGTHSLNKISAESEENGGGVMIGCEETTFLIRNVAIRSIEGRLLYYHSFRDGMGEWKADSDRTRITERGELLLTDGRIILSGNYRNVEIEVECKRLSGRQCLVVGAGFQDGLSYAVAVSYGKKEKDYGVSFEKWVDGEKVESSFLGKEAFVGYSNEGNRVKLRYTERTFEAFFYKFGLWHSVLKRDTRKSNGRIFASATCTKDDKVVFKCVNAGEREEAAVLTFLHFGEKTKARLIRYPSAQEEAELLIEDNLLSFSLPPMSATLLVIE